jgi:hypothetical protein
MPFQPLCRDGRAPLSGLIAMGLARIIHDGMGFGR